MARDFAMSYEARNRAARAVAPRRHACDEPLHWQQIATTAAYVFVTFVSESEVASGCGVSLWCGFAARVPDVWLDPPSEQ
jgi:hypothetical protein